MIRTMGVSFRAGYFDSDGVEAGGAISTSVTSRRYTRLAHLDPCDVLIASPIKPADGLDDMMKQWGSEAGVFKCVHVHDFRAG